MRISTLWGDRGQAQELHWPHGWHERPTLAGLARGAALEVAAPAASIWLVVRGNAEVEAREGRFGLQAGQWLYLERASLPTVRAGGRALVLGLVLSAGLQAQLQQSAHTPMFPGSGTAPVAARRALLSLWRQLAREDLHPADAGRLLARALRQLAELQEDCGALVDRCPGRSLHRRRQVFARMQRAMQYLGRAHRPRGPHHRTGGADQHVGLVLHQDLPRGLRRSAADGVGAAAPGALGAAAAGGAHGHQRGRRGLRLREQLQFLARVPRAVRGAALGLSPSGGSRARCGKHTGHAGPSGLRPRLLTSPVLFAHPSHRRGAP